jgi:ATP-dependent HslUV protease subunit HslV
MKTHSTTILALRHRGVTVLAGDGQVTLGQQIVKHGARKVRRLHGGRVLCGFAGSAADGLTLAERLETKIQEFSGDLARAAVAMAKDWRTDRVLRRLEALMIAADKDQMFLLSGTGDVIEPDAPVIGIGAGGPVAQAAATALLGHTDLPAVKIAEAAMAITAKLDIYTNDQVVMETLE